MKLMPTMPKPTTTILFLGDPAAIVKCLGGINAWLKTGVSE